MYVCMYVFIYIIELIGLLFYFNDFCSYFEISLFRIGVLNFRLTQSMLVRLRVLYTYLYTCLHCFIAFSWLIFLL